MTSQLRKVAWYQARDVMRSRWVLTYGVFFAIVTEARLRFAGGDARAILSMTSIVLYLVPLVTVVFGTICLYHAREFIELLLAQPVRRGGVFGGLYLGLAAPLALALVSGICVPLLWHGGMAPGEGPALAALLGAGVALTAIFTAIAFCIAMRVEDRLKGVGVAIGVWMLGAILYDGLVLAVVAAFADYPLERPMLALMLTNPIDLARIVVLLQLDVSALMGYTGAVVQQFLGGATGTLAAAAALIVWFTAPVLFGLRTFRRKDF
jgi:Cu-processing system permease protein